MARVYGDALVGTVPQFPQEMEDRIDAYLSGPAEPETAGPIAALAPASIGSFQWIATEQSIRALLPRRLEWSGSVERLP